MKPAANDAGGGAQLLAQVIPFPRPEDFGCEAQRLEGLEIGPVTIVRLIP